jgi:hypothetical protein
MTARAGAATGRIGDVEEGPAALLRRLAEELALAEEGSYGAFAEMVAADMDEDPRRICPTPAAAELVLAPTTDAESAAARILAAAAMYARDRWLDDDSVRALMSLATVYAARFDSYLAERACG